MIIYLTTNLVNQKKYIGMDSNNNPNYLGSGSLILKAIKKYGRSNFKKEIIENCSSIKEMELKETYWINKFNALKDPSFYNLEDNRKRGTNPFQNKTEEEKQVIYKKRGEKQKGISKIGNKKPKPEYFSQEQKERFKNKGPRTEESKIKQSISMKGKKKNQVITSWKQSNTSKSLKPILQFNMVGNFIKEWNSINEAQIYFKGSQKENNNGYKHNGTHISNNINGRTKSAFGFIWKIKN
jgi:group I intron endonuclease